jgi:hypothetical protein
MKPNVATDSELYPASATKRIKPGVWALMFVLFCLAGAGIWFFI